MQLFILENNVAKPNVETLLLPPFSDIWDRDKSLHKEQAIREFTYIEFMASPKKTNPFSGYAEDIRSIKVRQAIFKEDQNWRPDHLINECILTYYEFFYNASPALSYLNAAKKSAEELKRFLASVDLTQRNPNGTPMYKPKEVTSALIDTFAVLKTINGLEEKVEQEIYENNKTKANKEINHFER